MAELVTCKIDTSGLMRMQNIVSKHSRWSPAENLNRTAFFVVKDAMEHTLPTAPAKIDMELNVQSAPRISARTGRPVSRNSRNPNIINVTEGGLATRITLARMHRNSRYNLRTDRRYSILRSTFSPGQGRAGFWKKVEETATRMVKQRHSSSGFFKSSWLAILQKLYPLLPPGYRRGASITQKPVNGSLGDVTPAVGGGLTCTCIVENNLGTESLYPTIAARRNAYAHMLLTPILQSAIDREFWSKLELADRKGWMDRASALRECGFIVTT